MDNSHPRNILVLTGTRAEYGLLRSSMHAINEHDNLTLSVIATGMHLSPRHGMTIDTIRADGFSVDREVLMQIEGDTGKSMAKSLGVGILGLTEAIDSISPEFVLVLGDRDEALAGALAAAHMNVPVAHIHGGEVMSGATIDDSIRHAITKFAHLHFPASERSAQRIRDMGEEDWRISVSGAPGLDDVLTGNYETSSVVLERYSLDDDKPLILVLQHPITAHPEQAGGHVRMTLDAVESFDANVVIIYPNSDAGSEQIIEEIDSRSGEDHIHVFKNLPREEYLGLLAAADLMVGNSSSAIIEAPSFNLPVIDIGPRQQGRERADNTLSVPHDANEIQEAIDRCLTDESLLAELSRVENPYDYGGAANVICERLADIDIDDRVLQKKFIETSEMM